MRIIAFPTFRVLAEGDDAGDVGGSGQDAHCFERGHGYGVRVGMWIRWTAFRMWEKNKRVWTPRRIAGSWLIYSCINQRETVYNRRRERDEEEREAPREPALKCWQDEHYRQVTDWQDYCKIYHYHTALSGPGITWIFTYERFWARHYKKEEKGEIDVDNQRIKSLQKSHFEEVAGWQTTVGTRIYPIRTFLCGPGITSIYPHRDSDDNTWKSFCKRTIWEGDR